MRSLLSRAGVVIALIATGASPSAAQGDWRIEFHADRQMNSCSATYSALQATDVHMFLTGSGSATAVRFAAYLPECLAGASWLGDVIDPSYLFLFDTQAPEGLSVAFTGCRPLPVYLGYMTIQVTDPVLSCCELVPIRPTSTIETYDLVAVDCAFNDHPIAAGALVVGPDGSCPCLVTVGTEEATWGRVKALYR